MLEVAGLPANAAASAPTSINTSSSARCVSITAVDLGTSGLKGRSLIVSPMGAGKAARSSQAPPFPVPSPGGILVTGHGSRQHILVIIDGNRLEPPAIEMIGKHLMQGAELDDDGREQTCRRTAPGLGWKRSRRPIQISAAPSMEEVFDETAAALQVESPVGVSRRRNLRRNNQLANSRETCAEELLCAPHGSQPASTGQLTGRHASGGADSRPM